MKIFLDVNILVSVLNNEYPLFTHSSRVLSLADNKKFHVLTSPICIAIAFYFSEKKSGAVLAKKKLELLTSKIDIATCTRAEVLSATRNKAVHDLEDGIEYYSAIRSGCKCIVTEDVKDFYFSDIEVLNSSDFLEKYLNK